MVVPTPSILALTELNIIVDLLQSDYGWLVLLLFIAYQLFDMRPGGHTKFQSIIGSFEDDLGKLRDRQLMTITVVRAMSKSIDDIDDVRVDDYLARNGKSVDYFITEGDKDAKDSDSSDDSESSKKTLDQFHE